MPDNMSAVGIIVTTICFLFSLLVSGFCLFPFWRVVRERRRGEGGEFPAVHVW